MANALYDNARNLFLTGGLNWGTDTVKVALLTSAYTFSASDQFYSTLSANVVGTPAALANKTDAAGVADADDLTFSAVTGSAVAAYVLYKDTGTTTTSPLIAFFDTVSSGLPVTPNGGSITITWDNGSNKIFKL